MASQPHVEDSSPAGEAVTLNKFDDLPLSDEGKLAMREGFGYEYQTPVQANTFGLITQGADVVVRAKTGAGKTLSFLLPAMERMKTLSGGSKSAGAIDVLVISPVRELSMQIAQEAEKLVKYYSGIRAVCMTGGVDWKEDVEALDACGSDVIFLIATPGRIQSHVSKTDGFAQRLAQVQIVVLDEVDQLASDIFRSATQEIISALTAPERQSLFYSATLSEDVTKLVQAAAKPEYTYVDMLQSEEISVPEQIDQTYIVVPTEEMTAALWTAIQSAQSYDDAPPKIVVILMTGRIASYYAEAFRQAKTGLDVFEIHARLKQNKRTAESDKFRAAASGILFTSDVSSRGLDYPGETTSDMPDFVSMKIAQNVKAQAYYSRINHVMRNSYGMQVLEILREAKRYAASIGALDSEGRPPEITEENAIKMGVADISDPALNMVAGVGNTAAGA